MHAETRVDRNETCRPRRALETFRLNQGRTRLAKVKQDTLVVKRHRSSEQGNNKRNPERPFRLRNPLSERQLDVCFISMVCFVCIVSS